MLKTNEIMTEIFNQINLYIYPEYVVAVIVITALVRYLFYGIDKAIHAKWITLVIGVVLGVVGYALKTLASEQYDFFKVLISFGVSTLGYDYLWKVIKDTINKKQHG